MFYQAFTAYCQAAGLAMQIQQEMLRPWVNLWLMAMAAAAGGERTEPIQTMQKRRLGDSEAFDTQGTSARTAEGARIEVREEELRAHKQLVEAGEVRVRKEVVTEHRTLEAPVQREEVVIERRAPTGELVEEIRIPVREEQVTVERRPVVKEEVTVGKRVAQGTERVGGEVHKEMVRVEREGDVDVHGDGPGQGDRSPNCQ
ncbi:MAG: YsnF/AvaK domain-containing protein [Planctomycetaceae bacterium]|nr:YsnF/AvaK domain-containing protein [Planctomycetaceae bacterium]